MNTASILSSIELKWLSYSPVNWISSADHTGCTPHYFLAADTIAQDKRYGLAFMKDFS